MKTYPQSTIQKELSQLAGFYGLGNAPLITNPDGLPLCDDYLEVVLAENHFELVIGGVGQEVSLSALAVANGFPEPVIKAFEACTAIFSGKMLYAKFAVGAPGQAGSLYVVIIEPWEKVLPFLQGKLFSGKAARAIEDMRAKAGRSEIVFILGFSQDEEGELLAKVYHLFDRSSEVEAGNRFLVSHRLTASDTLLPPKYYDARVEWEDLATSARWQALAAFAQSLYGNRYAMLSGHSTQGTTKAYVLRHDRRETHLFSHLTYNYYVEEGLKLIQCFKYEAATEAFINAIDFDGNDANAYNGLGLAHILSGNFTKGVEYAFRARELNPAISNYVWHAPVPYGVEQEIKRLSAELDSAPTADGFNARGVQLFLSKQFAEAIEDFQKAIGLKKLHAEAHNNLAGAYIKTGRFAEAVKAAHIARSLSGTVSSGNWEIARQAMQYAHDIEVAPTPERLNNFGVFCYQLDLYEDAMSWFVQAEELAKPVVPVSSF